MKTSLVRCVTLALVLAGVSDLALAQGTAPATSTTQAPAKLQSAIDPVSRANEAVWRARDEMIVANAKAGADLVFLGDSITRGWENAGKDAWAKHYGTRNALNAGIDGDRTQHVLWRLDHGLLDALVAAPTKPRLFVVMIGTNNSNGNDNTAEEIGDGIVAIVKRIQSKLPESKVLLLAIFPRGERPSAQREKNAQASERAFSAQWNENVRTLDIGAKFLQSDGTLTKEVMPDLLHLSYAAYETWAMAIEPIVAEAVPAKR